MRDQSPTTGIRRTAARRRALPDRKSRTQDKILPPRRALRILQSYAQTQGKPRCLTRKSSNSYSDMTTQWSGQVARPKSKLWNARSQQNAADGDCRWRERHDRRATGLYTHHVAAEVNEGTKNVQ